MSVSLNTILYLFGGLFHQEDRVDVTCGSNQKVIISGRFLRGYTFHWEVLSIRVEEEQWCSLEIETVPDQNRKILLEIADYKIFFSLREEPLSLTLDIERIVVCVPRSMDEKMNLSPLTAEERCVYELLTLSLLHPPLKEERRFKTICRRNFMDLVEGDAVEVEIDKREVVLWAFEHAYSILLTLVEEFPTLNLRVDHDGYI